ncbi:MAG: ORF6N domain-containing protein [Delftia acidovorans]|jgi:hypothetical protein|nr:ORF6N domain-containing protein [Delftia acidovorans]
MSNIVTIAGVQSARITYKDRPVCTTQQLAQFYGCTEKNIGDNYANNRDRFEEGKHFVFLEGEALKHFKQGIPDQIGDPLKFTARLMLWTELGSARHAKMLSTEKAWDVFEELEEAYFSRALHMVGQQPSALRDQVDASILLLRAAAEDLKFAPSALLGGYQKLESHVGVTGLLPAYAIDAPTTSSNGSSEETKSLQELLSIHDVGMGAAAFNRLLMQRGFVEERERPSTKGSGVRKFKVCANLVFGKNLTTPNNPRETQPHWYVSKFAELLDLVLPTKRGPAT